MIDLTLLELISLDFIGIFVDLFNLLLRLLKGSKYFMLHQGCKLSAKFEFVTWGLINDMVYGVGYPYGYGV